MKNTSTEDSENTPHEKTKFLISNLRAQLNTTINVINIVDAFRLADADKYLISRKKGAPLIFRRVSIKGNRIRILLERVTGMQTEISVQKFYDKFRTGEWRFDYLPNEIEKTPRIKLKFL